MHLELNSDNPGWTRPPAAQAFATARDSPLIRSMAHYYKLSWFRVIERFRSVLEELRRLDTSSRSILGSFHCDNLAKCQALLINALVEHVDDCHYIVECIYADDETTVQNKKLREFVRAVGMYRAQLAPVDY